MIVHVFISIGMVRIQNYKCQNLMSKFALQIQNTGSCEKPTYVLLSVHKCLHASQDISRRTESPIRGKLHFLGTKVHSWLVI